VHGHGVPELDAAVREQLAKVAHTTLLGMGNVPSILLAKKLVEVARGAGMELPRVFYSDNGSTAVEVACKMAFQRREARSQKPGAKRGRGGARFIAFENSYHGDTIGAVSVGGIEAFHGVFKPLCFETDFVKVGEGAAAEIERLLAARPGEYVAVVIEPVIQGAGGMIVHPPGTLKKVREICDRHKVMLIADEVLTGFGRTGTMFACEREQVTPDFLCLSKGLTGGYMPLGATLTTEAVFQDFYADPREGKTFFHGHTYTGHPLACAAALASIELMESSKLLELVRKLEPILQEMLDAAKRLPLVHEVRRAGLIGAIELRDASGAAFPYHWRVGGAVCRDMRDFPPVGLLTRPLADTVVVMPPLAIREENLRYLCKGVLQSLGRTGEILARIRQDSPPTPTERPS
jgi:adenosylmethionine-8-amino-7-oxononanoate aminotransferase